MKPPSPARLADKPQTLATLAPPGSCARSAQTAWSPPRWPAGGDAGGRRQGLRCRSPDELGPIDESRTLTFRRFHERSNALAAAGIRTDDGVAIMCRNHRGWVEASA